MNPNPAATNIVAKMAIVVSDPVRGSSATGAAFAGATVVAGTVAGQDWPAAAVSDAVAVAAPTVPVIDSGDAAAPHATSGTADWKQPVSGSAFQFSCTRGGIPSSHACESAEATVLASRIKLG